MKHPDEATQKELLAALKEQCGPAVDQVLKDAGEDGLDEATLKRWLVARKFDVAAAKKDLTKHAEWRKQNCHIQESEVAEEIAQEKVFLSGYDKSDHPIIIIRVKKHLKNDHEKLKRFMVYCLDIVAKYGKCRPEWDGKVICILDLKGSAYANMDASALRAIFDILQHHFPERLYRMFLYFAPTVFHGVWSMVSPFVDPVTREKVVFVTKADALTKLAEAIPSHSLPEWYGGTGSMKPFPEVAKELALAGSS